MGQEAAIRAEGEEEEVRAPRVSRQQGWKEEAFQTCVRGKLMDW